MKALHGEDLVGGHGATLLFLVAQVVGGGEGEDGALRGLVGEAHGLEMHHFVGLG